MSGLIKEHLKRFEPFKIEFLDEKNHFYQLSSSIEQVTDEYMIISPPKFGDQVYNLPVDAEISIIFYRNDGILHGVCKILSKQSGENARLKLSTPYDVELTERRRAKRLRLSFQSEIEYLINKNDTKKKVLNVLTNDVNVYGVSYLDTEPLGRYYNIRCKIYVEGYKSEPVCADCRFVYSQKKQIKGKLMYKTALEFIKISAEDIERLQQKCYKKSYA